MSNPDNDTLKDVGVLAGNPSQEGPKPSEDVTSLSHENSNAVQDADLIAKGDEEALESEEVIELQLFSEKQAWIDEKIKVNQSLATF